MSGPIVPYNNQIRDHRHHQQNYQRNGSQSQSQSCQVICDHCKTLLDYRRGTTRICCAVCRTIKNVPAEGTEVAQRKCSGCGLTLMYPAQALAVKCSSCKTITCTKPNSDDSEDQTVIVENPNTLDDNGLLFGSSLSVGIRVKRRH